MNDDRNLTVDRVRHPLKMRLLKVLRTHRVSPQLLRVTLGGEDLADFVSGSFDDHIKVFFPPAGAEKPALPEVGADGIRFPEGQPRPETRDYTPRGYDNAARELDIEFVLHGDGPASTWAAQAQPGQYLGVGGPRERHSLHLAPLGPHVPLELPKVGAALPARRQHLVTHHRALLLSPCRPLHLGSGHGCRGRAFRLLRGALRRLAYRRYGPAISARETHRPCRWLLCLVPRWSRLRLRLRLHSRSD